MPFYKLRNIFFKVAFAFDHFITLCFSKHFKMGGADIIGYLRNQK
jgi:hypothetical protein